MLKWKQTDLNEIAKKNKFITIFMKFKCHVNAYDFIPKSTDHMTLESSGYFFATIDDNHFIEYEGSFPTVEVLYLNDKIVEVGKIESEK